MLEFIINFVFCFAVLYNVIPKEYNGKHDMDTILGMMFISSIPVVNLVITGIAIYDYKVKKR